MLVGQAGVASQQARVPGNVINADSVRECKENQPDRADWPCVTADCTVLSGKDAVLFAVGRESGCDGRAPVDTSVTAAPPTVLFERPPFSSGSPPLVGPFATLAGGVGRTQWNSSTELRGAIAPHSIEKPPPATPVGLSNSDASRRGTPFIRSDVEHLLPEVDRESQSGGYFDFATVASPQPKHPPTRPRVRSSVDRDAHTANGGSSLMYSPTFEALLGLDDSKGNATPVPGGTPPGRNAGYKQQDATTWDPMWPDEGGSRHGDVAVQPLQIVRARVPPYLFSGRLYSPFLAPFSVEAGVSRKMLAGAPGPLSIIASEAHPVVPWPQSRAR